MPTWVDELILFIVFLPVVLAISSFLTNQSDKKAKELADENQKIKDHNSSTDLPTLVDESNKELSSSEPPK